MQNGLDFLTGHLKGPLGPLYFLYGNDEGQKQNAKDDLLKAAVRVGYQTRFTYELNQTSDWRA